MLLDLANRGTVAQPGYASIAEMVDVVYRTLAIANLNERAQHFDNVFVEKDSFSRDAFPPQATVELHAANRRQVVSLACEEQVREEILGRFFCGRLSRTHHPIDLDECFESIARGIDSQGV